MDALYLHVPFCFHKCHYCDFYSLVEGERPSRQAAFTDRLIAELELRARQLPLTPRTLFVGGGTPTLLAAEHWTRLLAAMRRLGVLDAVEEFTVEANPETVEPALMDALAAGGVNRVSLGAQSFDPASLKALERWHDPASVERAVGRVRAAGIGNINLDLIFAIPGQDLAALGRDLDAALALAPEHLSCYGLTYEPQTALTKRLERGRIVPAPEDLEREMYALVLDRLEGAGFDHYEVSAWARRGGLADTRQTLGGERADGEPRAADRHCRHNLTYWTNGNWLGAGPAAASHLDGTRWRNPPHLGKYLASAGEPPTADHERLSEVDRFGEELMLRLRLREGAPRAWLNPRLAGDPGRAAAVAEMEALGMLVRTPTHLRLTRAGLFVADSVLARLV